MNDPRALLSLHEVGVHVQVGAQAIRALDGVSLTARRGDRVGVMGASGAGKSTLLQVMCRLTKPSCGSVEVRPGCGMPSLVFQFPEYQLFSETVAEDVGYGLRQGGVPNATIEARVSEALHSVGLPPEAFATRVPFHLSGGEQRRVALAGALAQQRSLVLFDEPTLGLDASGVDHLCRLLDGLHHEDTAFWIASHDADFLAATCDRLLVLDAGRVAWDGDLDGFWEDTGRAEVLGVTPPHRVRLGAALRQLGCTLSAHPSEDALWMALLDLADGRPGADGPE